MRTSLSLPSKKLKKKRLRDCSEDFREHGGCGFCSQGVEGTELPDVALYDPGGLEKWKATTL